jgi:predicted phosphodiesterase
MIAIISDAHGNYPALKAVLSEIDKLNCGRIISLGDVSGYYCMVNECIDEFRRRNIVNLMGNHDYYVLGRGDCPRSYTVNKITEYQRKVITPENLKYLEESSLGIDDGFISARHGGWNDPIDEYIDVFDFANTVGRKEKIFCSGHTHVQGMVRDKEVVYFNPGSVGQPRDFDSRAAYAVIHDDGAVELRRVEYNIDEIAKAMNEAGFEERTYSCLYSGERIGGNPKQSRQS